MQMDSERRSFKLRDASVTGHGLQVPFRYADWPRLRDVIYEGRGG